jgi:hypothetical protein
MPIATKIKSSIEWPRFFSRYMNFTKQTALIRTRTQNFGERMATQRCGGFPAHTQRKIARALGSVDQAQAGTLETKSTPVALHPMGGRTMKLYLALAIALAILLSTHMAPCQAKPNDETPEDIAVKATTQMQYLASNIVAAAVCKDAQMNSEFAAGTLIRADIILGNARAQEIFLKTLRAAIEESSANNIEWCHSTITVAIARKSEMLKFKDGEK